LRRTLSGTPEDLKRFLSEFPASPYRDTIVEKLFRQLTITGSAESLQTFKANYPESRYAQVCADLLAWRKFETGHGRWIPTSDKGLFGFLNLEGRTVVKPYLLALPEAWRCPPGDTGLVALPDAIFDRSGKKLIDGNYTRATHIGSGFILASNSATELLHASGWKPVTGPVNDAMMIGREFIAVKTAAGWSVNSINGQRILPDQYDSIRQEGTLIILRKNNRFYLVPAATLIDHGQGKGEYMVADEIRMLQPGIFLLRNGDAQEAVNDQLQPVVDIGIQRIQPTPFGLRIERDGLTELTGWPGLEKKRFRSVDIQGKWMKTILGDSASLFNIPERKKVLSAPDSLWFSRGFLFARKLDSIYVFTPDNKRITTGRGDITAFKTAIDSSLFFLVKKKKQLILYDISTGKKVISGIYEDIQPVNRNYFIVRLKNKAGLVNVKGKELLTADYDAILFRDGWFSLLRQGKFGAFHPVTGRMIKPQFEANLIPLSTTMIMARKKQKWGVIGPAQKPELAAFPYDEITPLSDTLAMARISTLWNVIDLHSGKSIAGSITNWQEVPGADRIVLKSDGKYGMLSPSAGMVIPPRYEEILWWSDDQHFLLMGIRQENDQYAMLEYFNRHGTPVRKQQVTKAGIDDFICED
ncbi:MAG: WG repeat-containing protein, partial [Bacteroidota bacterium]